MITLSSIKAAIKKTIRTICLIYGSLVEAYIPCTIREELNKKYKQVGREEFLAWSIRVGIPFEEAYYIVIGKSYKAPKNTRSWSNPI